MGANIRKRFIQLMCLAMFLGAVWAIREYGIFEFFESLFGDPMQHIPDVDINQVVP